MGSYPPPGGFVHFAGVGDKLVTTGPATLHAFNVGTAASGAQTKIYSGTSTTGTLVSVVDCSSSTGRNFVFDVNCPAGLYVVSTGNATVDVTLSYF